MYDQILLFFALLVDDDGIFLELHCTSFRMVNQEFCEFLEYELCRVFRQSDNPEVRGFWCDGVVLPNIDERYFHKQVQDKRCCMLAAWIGTDGQTNYELTLRLGNKALSRYARGLSLKECIPAESSDWFTIDIQGKSIDILLE